MSIRPGFRLLAVKSYLSSVIFSLSLQSKGNRPFPRLCKVDLSFRTQMLFLQRTLTSTRTLKNYPILILSWPVSLVWYYLLIFSLFLVKNELRESRTLSCSLLCAQLTASKEVFVPFFSWILKTFSVQSSIPPSLSMPRSFLPERQNLSRGL